MNAPAPAQRRRRTDLEKLLDKVKETPGFNVRSLQGGDLVQVASTKGHGFHRFTIKGPDPTTLENAKAQLTRLGWTEDLYNAAKNITPDDDTGDESELDTDLPPAKYSLDEQRARALERITKDIAEWKKEVIGPEEAKIYLEMHREAAEERGRATGLTDDPLPLDAPEQTVRQRKLLKGHVHKLAREIRAGLWKLSTQGISIGVDGWIADGQHRLEAIILANAIEAFWVAHGVDDEIFPYFDRGRPRSDRDVLYTQGKSADPALPAAVRLLYLYDNVSDITKWGNHKATPAGGELLQYAAKHYGSIDEDIKACSGFRGRECLTVSSAIALRFVIRRADPEAEVDAFLEAVRFGFGAEEGSSTSALKRLGDNRFKRHRKTGRETSQNLFLAGIWTWNKYLERVAVRSVGYQERHGIPKVESFASIATR